MTALAHVVDHRRPDGTPRRPRLEVAIISPEWVSAVGPPGTVKKEFTAHVDGRQIGRLLLYREVDGRFDISGIGVQDIYRGRAVASQLLDFAFMETGADHFTLSTGTTGDGTQLVHTYGEGRRAGCRVVERPGRLGQAAVADCDSEASGERHDPDDELDPHGAPR
ncbi:hypothetical protein ACFPOU_08310 [Massilia jejuensis]|uniref:Acetyltransferase (GNAT) family protein n=1 Tax=Massilia jejuensis TaxID=648894 RepID=A0ABW0PGT2_9BURK